MLPSGSIKLTVKITAKLQGFERVEMSFDAYVI